MDIKQLHSWQISTSQAIEIQNLLSTQISRKSEINTPNFIAGVDISVKQAQKTATGSVVVLNYPEVKIVETEVVRGKLNFPYIPGLLSFREIPLILDAIKELKITPDLIVVDGQGIAHPRRFGLASHLGLLLDIPTIGCAKSLLCGAHEEPGVEPGSYSEIKDKGEVIGAVLRTKPGVKPVYISIGHKIDLQNAIHWIMECCRGYRLPEPTRLAHQVAKGSLERGKEITISSQEG